jgi:hypothetical protein
MLANLIGRWPRILVLNKDVGRNKNRRSNEDKLNIKSVSLKIG